MTESNAARYIRRLDDYLASFEASLIAEHDADIAGLLDGFRALRCYLVRETDIDVNRFSAMLTYVADMCAESADLREHLLGNMKDRMQELDEKPSAAVKPTRAFTLVKH